MIKINQDHLKKVQDHLKKVRGEVFTPHELVDEMLDKLDPTLWVDKSKKWLDPACGSGNFLIAVKDRLMKGLKMAIPDPDAREKHILEEMIFGMDIRELNVLWTLERLGGGNIECCDSLKSDCKFGGKSPTGTFDVVVGNPPFQLIKEDLVSSGRWGPSHKLYIDFIETFVKKAPLLVFIVPSTWVPKKNNKVYRVTNNKITDITHVAKEAFSVGVSVCYFTYDSKGPTIKHPQLLNLPVTVSLGTLYSRLQHLNRNDPRINKGTIPVVDITGAKELPPQITTAENIDTSKYPHYNLWKVITNTNGGYETIGAIKIVGPGYITTTGVVSFGVDTEQKAKNLQGYMETKFVGYYVKQIKRATANALHVFKKIPLVDLSKSWTDQELYEHFKLTPEQIKEIEEVTK